MRKALFIVLTCCLTLSAFGQIATNDIRFNTVRPEEQLVRLLKSKFGDVNGQLLRYMADPSGRVYYVDGNKTISGNGSSWDDAFNTLSAAMAASHADIAVSAYRKWAARNTIFVRADGITEDLTTMAQKTDIIGCGSNNAYNGKAKITGTWIIPTTPNYMGCRFYNMMFTDAGANAIFTVDGQDGLEFHNCIFEAAAATTAGITATECPLMVVNGCEFSAYSGTHQFDTHAIKIGNDTIAVINTRISNNTIIAAGIGIDWDETASYGCIISNNFFMTDGMCVDSEDIAGVMVVNNTMISTLEPADNTMNDFNKAYAVNNKCTGPSSSLISPTFSDD